MAITVLFQFAKHLLRLSFRFYGTDVNCHHRSKTWIPRTNEDNARRAFITGRFFGSASFVFGSKWSLWRTYSKQAGLSTTKEGQSEAAKRE